MAQTTSSVTLFQVTQKPLQWFLSARKLVRTFVRLDWIHKTATHFLRYVVHTCDIIITYFRGKISFHEPNKFVVFNLKAVEQKQDTLKMFPQEKC